MHKKVAGAESRRREQEKRARERRREQQLCTSIIFSMSDFGANLDPRSIVHKPLQSEHAFMMTAWDLALLVFAWPVALFVGVTYKLICFGFNCIHTAIVVAVKKQVGGF